MIPAIITVTSYKSMSYNLVHRHTAVSKTAKASVHSVKMAPVLVCTCHLIFGQCPDVLPLPPAVCVRAVGGL